MHVTVHAGFINLDAPLLEIRVESYLIFPLMFSLSLSLYFFLANRTRLQQIRVGFLVFFLFYLFFFARLEEGFILFYWHVYIGTRIEAVRNYNSYR